MDQILASFAVAGIVVCFYMIILFIVAICRANNSIADIAWGPGFVLAGLTAFLYHEAFGSRNYLVMALLTIWGLRLGIRIYLRNRGHAEDWRYKKWRDEWGRMFYLRSFFQVFILQGMLLIVNLTPVLIVHSQKSGAITWLDAIGLAIWVIGFIFETTGDWQLDRFLKDKANRGKVMDSGLWRYTRHPNYFGEVMMWWGIFVIALSSPFGYLGVAGPLVISFLILFVSGIPMTERGMTGDEAFEAYKKRTSVFIPWFPKNRRKGGAS
jgi:steroid 5-alpha reductase family enzyme